MSITEEKIIKEFAEVSFRNNYGEMHDWLKSTLEQVIKETEERVRKELNPNKKYFKHKKGCPWGDKPEFAHLVPIGCPVGFSKRY